MTLREIFFFILHTFSTLHLFSSLGYNLGQNILATSVDDDFTVPLPPLPNVGDSLMLKIVLFLAEWCANSKNLLLESPTLVNGGRGRGGRAYITLDVVFFGNICFS